MQKFVSLIIHILFCNWVIKFKNLFISILTNIDSSCSKFLTVFFWYSSISSVGNIFACLKRDITFSYDEDFDIFIWPLNIIIPLIESQKSSKLIVKGIYLINAG